ncbi:MAG TPA: alginate lyase family protein [Stellaceae bacterium]|nr:alginate lyase family protein [Stellaceae bacterium]
MAWRASNLGWRLRRLRRMSGREVGGRLRDAAIKHLWRCKALRPQPRLELPMPSAPTLPGPDVLPLAVSATAGAALGTTAERILAGRIAVLGQEWPAGAQPEWFVDVRTGKRVPHDAYAFDIDHRDPDVVGDVKYVWEPSRHHHLTVLAAAYYLTGDDAFAERAAAHLRSWWEANPFLCGVHWTSGIELGIRLISWVWVRRLLAGWAGAAALFEDNRVFRRQLYDHQVYLARLRSHGSSANNHLVAELAGLFAAAAAFPLFGESAGWRSESARLLAREAARQTYPDGLNRELATAYHGLTFELMLLAAAEDDPAAPQFDPAFWARLVAMADALAAIVDVAGRPPRQGDEDGAAGLLVDGVGFDRWRSLLATAAAVFGGCQWWPRLEPSGDLRAALLAARLGQHALDERPVVRTSHFAPAGMALLRDLDSRPDELWCRCDHGPLGFLATAAHGHADALSLELRHGGVDILSDPGTYCYHGLDGWRAYFRSTRGHNTLELDETDQARSGGLFLWLDRPETALVRARGLDGGDIAEWVAEHRGYERLPAPAIHRRHIALDRQRRTIEIADSIARASPHPARLAFHFGPEVACRLAGGAAHLAWSAAGRRWRAVMTLPEALHWSLHRGEREPLLGWYSREYGALEPSFTLVGQGTVAQGTLRTFIEIGEDETLHDARPAQETAEPAHAGD